jgi:hypothetical protein
VIFWLKSGIMCMVMRHDRQYDWMDTTSPLSLIDCVQIWIFLYSAIQPPVRRICTAVKYKYGIWIPPFCFSIRGLNNLSCLSRLARVAVCDSLLVCDPCLSNTGPCVQWTEAEFLDVIGTKVLRVFPLAIPSHLYKWVPPPPVEVAWSWFVV